jgi:hypothetical protein
MLQKSVFFASFLILNAVAAIAPAHAAMSPLSVSVVPPVQFPASDFSVTGLRAATSLIRISRDWRSLASPTSPMA